MEGNYTRRIDLWTFNLAKSKNSSAAAWEFVDKEVVPVAAKIDEEGQFPFTSCGFAMGYDVQRYFRDARLLLLGGGTSEILRIIISRQMGL